jgi:nondiscriminating glutamyl-tRNA synthetase
MTVRTRFAPSPTGELHLGNARIAVLNWLYARHCGGQFIVRIEDTDVDRNLPGSEDEILGALRRLGITWDEGPDVGGERGPYRQSERTSLYRAYAERLIASGKAYECFCSTEELDAKKQAALAAGAPPVYDGKCRHLDPEQARRLRQSGSAPAVRFLVPSDRVMVHDVVRGTIDFDASEFGDFVILKSDGLPTYNFAVVVDDSGMAISHVIRGVGHLANTPRQVMLYHAVDLEPPTFVHVPHVLAPDGSGLSKRLGARSLREYLEQGYHPDAIINYLSLLSWSSPSGEEVLPPDRLIAEIDLARLGASDVRLDPEKLEWMSGEYIRRMSCDELATRLTEFLEPDAFPDREGHRTRIARAIQERITTFPAAARFLTQFYPPDPMLWTAEALGVLRGTGVAQLLGSVKRALAEIGDWDGEVAVAAIRAAGKEIGAKGRDLFMPVRAALSGATQGPELVDILEIQGQATALRVLDQAIVASSQSSAAGSGDG